MLLGAVASLLQDRAFLLRVLAGRLYLGHASLCFANISESLFHKMQEICYTIMQLERNRYNPSMLLAYSIAKVFDVTIEELFDFSEVEK